MKVHPPSLFPCVDLATQALKDGTGVECNSFCKKAISADPKCKHHYRTIASKPEGYYQCPYGYTTRRFSFGGDAYAVTGVVAFPRFNSEAERRAAKQYPNGKVARKSIDSMLQFLADVEKLRADLIQDGAKVLPQAFHELRKLNGAILQLAERELGQSDSPTLRSINSAAELMRNNFDILEALSNIEGMRALPSDSTVNLYDLVYKVNEDIPRQGCDSKHADPSERSSSNHSRKPEIISSGSDRSDRKRY
jgi:hypothetical protein